MRCVWCSVVCAEIFKRDKRCIKYFLKLCYTRHKNDKCFFITLEFRVFGVRVLQSVQQQNFFYILYKRIQKIQQKFHFLPYPLLPLV